MIETKVYYSLISSFNFDMQFSILNTSILFIFPVEFIIVRQITNSQDL